MSSSKIKDPKKVMKFYFKIFLGCYAVLLFVGLHIDRVIEEYGMMTLMELTPLITKHIESNPLNIFPIRAKAVGIITYIAAIIGILLYVEWARRKRLRTTDEYGSAAWNLDLKSYYYQFADTYKKYKYKGKSKLIKKIVESLNKSTLRPTTVNDKNGTKNMIFSEKVVMSMNTRQTMRNNNVLIVGGSGSGKTRFEVKPNALQANCSYVFTDPSGEILASIGDFLEKQGYEIKVFNLVQMAHSHSYNPFNYIRDEQGVLTMITALIKNTTPRGSTSSDPFWEKAETALLQAICFYLYYECNMEDRNFGNVMKLIRCAEVKEEQSDYQSTLDIMFEQVEKKNPEHIAVRQYKVFKQAAGKTAKTILVSCSVRLAVFNMQVIQKLTGIDTIDLTSIGDKKTALFCITPIVDPTLNFLVALLYTQLFESLYYHAENECEGKRLPIHVRFMLDEFANIGTIPDFEQKLATMRKYEISCTIIIQNMAQLKTMYKDCWESITGNCDTLIFLGGNEQGTFEYVSKELGKETIVTQTDNRSFGKQGGSSRNKSIIGRELMTPTEIGQMSTMDSIIKIRGIKPFFDRKYDYPKHPNYQYTGDADDKYLYDVNRINPAKISGNRVADRKRMMRLRHQREVDNIKKIVKEEKPVEEGTPHTIQNTPANIQMDLNEQTICEVTQTENVEEAVKSIEYINGNVGDFEIPKGSEVYLPELIDSVVIDVANVNTNEVMEQTVIEDAISNNNIVDDNELDENAIAASKAEKENYVETVYINSNADENDEDNMEIADPDHDIEDFYNEYKDEEDPETDFLESTNIANDEDDDVEMID